VVVVAKLASEKEEGEFYDKLFQEEDKQDGKISCKVLCRFFAVLGGPILLTIVILLSLWTSVGENAGYYLLTVWTEHFSEDTLWRYFGFWTLFMYAWSIAPTFRTVILVVSQLRLSRGTHRKMLFRVMHSKIDEFIERVPVGRIVNRFSKDIDNIDSEIIGSFNGFMVLGCYTVANIATVIYTTSPYMSLIVIPVFMFGFWFQNYYMNIKRELVRFEAITRSPILEQVGDTIKGLTVIRSLGLQSFLRKKFITNLENNFKNALMTYGLDAWYALRTALVNIWIVQIPAYLVLAFFFKTSNVSPKDLAFFFFGAMEMIRLMLWMIVCQCNFESKLVSYERCIHFEEIQPEKMYTRFEEESRQMNDMANGKYIAKYTPQKIVTEGAIRFKNVSCRYNERSDLVLKDLEFEVRPKEKIGIVGRSGAGKSTLIKLMWQCMTPCQGQVMIDGVDIAQCDLKDWRSQVMVISQDTCLFEGSLKENIDPLDQMKDDSKLTHILERLNFGHKDYESSGLKMGIEADGGNLSQGEKQ
jgi:ATP-binding cassette subfamily C (CFTR/MRP) protein 1